MRQHVRCLSRASASCTTTTSTSTRWPLDRRAPPCRRSVAIHCVTAAQLVVTVAALRQAGTRPGTGSSTPPWRSGFFGRPRRTGPHRGDPTNFVAERGDEYLAEVPAEEHGQLWRVASLLRAGVAVALSTDMPFGRDDPWAPCAPPCTEPPQWKRSQLERMCNGANSIDDVPG
ncbi:amidohydrolase family domain protein [Mycobacterium xenopi 4042]|uniref:Amidohydrolase family domain protein n=1 Tax=Mycobacterium xenopi 4042 TaxID=1299334 RepID=X8AGZ7_MYCXE|nr:amidohydrolase family domain protein [Mycobacterium xenopi 4042]